jgi:hypothetical protein
MTANDDFAIEFRTWLDAEARPPVPARALERALEVTAARRPRHRLIAGVGSHWVEASPVDSMRPRVREPLTSNRLVLLTIVALLVVALAGGAALVGRRADPRPSTQALPSMSTTSLSPSTQPPTASAPAVAESSPPPWGEVSGSWPGPVHTVPKGTVKTSEVRPSGTIWWQDKGDVALDWVDISRVTTAGGAGWNIVLRGRPPDPAELDAEDSVLSYGLVFDTTGDGQADYVLGINNGVSDVGDFATWVTDLRSGETEEHLGGPYGRPFDFSHPNESANSLVMAFWFIGDSAPHGLNDRPRFYAWSALRRGGETVSWDYAPDAAWLRFPGGAARG